MRRSLKYSLALLMLAASAPVTYAQNKPDDNTTLKDLRQRTISIKKQAMPSGDELLRKSIQGYQSVLSSPMGGAMRREAMRRLADRMIDQLEAQEEARASDAKTAIAALIPDASYDKAIKLYNEALTAYPTFPGNEHILYQMARAYEANAEPKQALWALDTLVTNHPDTEYTEEVNFRRGELAFLLRQYDKSAAAYEELIKKGPENQFYQISFYKAGWALFKKKDYKQAMDRFFGLIDFMTADATYEDMVADLPAFTIGQQEMLRDTLRVIGITLSHQEDPVGYLEKYLKTQSQRRPYEFKIYAALADMFNYQELYQDAATVYEAFKRSYPSHPQAPFFQLMAIETYKKGRFGELGSQAIEDFAASYGFKSPYWDGQKPELLREQLAPYLRIYLGELAQHYHAEMQLTKSAQSKQQALKWYRAYLDSFPKDNESAHINFLLAELLFESGNYSEAAREYNNTAYSYGKHPEAKEAAYAAILAYDKHRETLSGEARLAWERDAVENALHFAKVYRDDERVPVIITKTAQDLYAVKAYDTAIKAASVVLSLPSKTKDMERSSLLVLGHSHFERNDFRKAENSYKAALALTQQNHDEFRGIQDRYAASIYKQGEELRNQNNLLGAVREFSRLIEVAPTSDLRPTAEYDMATSMLALKDWQPAIRIFERIRNTPYGMRYSSEITQKLTVAYLETGQDRKAAGELERLSLQEGDYDVQREAVWRAAELYEKAGDIPGTIQAFENYAKRYSYPLDAAVEARYKLSELSKKQGNNDRHAHWLVQVVETDKLAGAQRTSRTRYLAGISTIQLADIEFEKYTAVRLVNPIKQNLKLKRDFMQSTINAYGSVSEFGVAELVTAATFKIAEIYRDFGKALIESERPKDLDKDELEMYEIMLEEQAFPFEEKAIGLHEQNIARVKEKVYDKWVKQSFAVLGKLNPGRYGKVEKAEYYIEVLN